MSQAYPGKNFSTKELGLLKCIGIEGEVSLARLARMEANAVDVIFQPGDSSKAFLILLDGRIRVDLITKSDREIVLYRMRRAETCIITATMLLQSCTYFARGIAETNITALALPQVDFELQMQRSQAFTHFVLQDYARRVSSLVGLVDRLTAKDVLADISAYLRSEMDGAGHVYITQAALARNIGTAREVVSRKLASLEKQGIVHRKRGKIIVIDKSKLL